MIGGSDIARLAAYERRAEQQAQAEAWPEGVTARYLTVAGATVDVTDQGTNTTWRYDTTCTGCPHEDTFRIEDSAHRSAQTHAERCRALPKPAQ
jgi:TPP-dependent indolepyruvate ferredoxin oxidoreductase alpha subunit